MWWITAAGVVVGLVGAARKPPPAWGAVVLGGGIPLLSQVLYEDTLGAGAYLAAAAVGLVAGVVLHQALPRIGGDLVAARWTPWLCQAAWGAGLLWLQYAEREHTISGFRRALGFLAFAGATWVGFALARRARPHLSELIVDKLPASEIVRTADVGEPAMAAPSGGAVSAAAAAPAPAPAWHPTHTVPPAGLDARLAPDPSQAVAARLNAGLPVRVIDRRGDWACVDAPNGWSGWVDGRLLA